jgi:membrane protease YdiL (CAAX protease family)
MSLAPVTTIPEAASDTVAAPAVEQANLRWFEVGLLMVLAFGSSLAACIHVLTHGTVHWPPFTNERWIVSGIHEAGCLGLLGYILHRRGLRIRDLGVSWSRRNIILGAGLYVGAMFSYAFGLWLIHWAQYLLTGTYSMPTSAAQIFGHPTIMAFAFAFLNPFFEELIVRAYLMTEINKLTGSMMLAGLVSVLLQASYHLYYGWTGAAAMAFLFAVFAVYYARTRNATPIIMAHFLLDIVAMVHLARISS